MDWLPMCAELEMVVGSQKWLDMMVLYCQKSVTEDREFDVIATAKTAVFFKETMGEDDGRVLLLHDLEKQAEERELEKEFMPKALVTLEKQCSFCSGVLAVTYMDSCSGEGASLPKCRALRDVVGGWDWAAMMVLYCRSSAAEDRDFARRMNQLL
ncbi:hypothetical protein Tco_0592921 [Tanacetum coccineum]